MSRFCFRILFSFSLGNRAPHTRRSNDRPEVRPYHFHKRLQPICAKFVLNMIVCIGVLLLPILLKPVTAARDSSFLMIGNSFTDNNNLQEMIQSMLKQDAAYGGNIYSMRFRTPASRFADDIMDKSLHSTIAERRWTWVVLQEQSQIPAFWDTQFQGTFDTSIQAAQKLNTWIDTEGHAETILMMTWGRRTNDWAWYPDMFPDFPTMQDRLTAGYLTMQNKTSTPERPVRIAPAGLAFQHIYSSIPGNASADGTDFSNLYELDGTHPAIQGSFLVALVTYVTMTGHDPRKLAILGPPNISKQRQEALKEVAWTVCEKFNRENEWNRKYWELHPPEEPSNNVPNPPSEPSHSDESKGQASGESVSSFGRFVRFIFLVGIGVGIWYYRKRGLRWSQYRISSSYPGHYSQIPHRNDFELTDRAF